MAEPKRQSKSRPKAPPYFKECPPSEWDINDYLDAELSRKGATHFDFGTASSNWNSTILHFSNHGKGDQVAFAKQKLADYRGCPGGLSDKARARNWRNVKNRKKRNATASPQTSPQPQQINYYAPVNQVVNGTFDGSLVNFNGNESAGGNHEFAPQSAAVVPEPDPDEIDTEEKRFSLLRKSLQELRRTMTTTLSLPSGGNLEDYLVKYAMGLSHIDPAHVFIADKKMLSTLSGEDKKQVLSQLEPLPAFPKELENILVKYKKVATLAQCRKASRKVTKSCGDEDIHWITRVFDQMVRLIENGHMSLDLGEGVLDTLVNSVLWDHYFLDIPDMLLKRKEITLSAMDDEPYKYLSYDPRFDGVLRTRVHGQDYSYELALFEVSGKYDKNETKKSNKDRTKLLAGCRAMLYRLQELVSNDENIIPKLRVVGVLQAGLHTQLFIMSFINSNVFHLRAGKAQNLPETYASLDNVSNVITLAWKAKRVIMDTAAAVRSYLKDAELKDCCADRTDPEWC